MRQKLGFLALSAAVESSPSGDVASGVAKKVSPSQGTGGGSTKVVIPLKVIENHPRPVSVSPSPQVSPRRRSVSPHRPLKRAHEEEESIASASPTRRRGEETSPAPFESPRKVSVSPQMGGGGDSILGERKRSETSTPHLVPRSPGRRRRFLSEAFEYKGRQGKVFRSSGERGTRISEFGESPVRNRSSANMSTQWDSRDSKSSGSSFLSNSWTSSCSTQTSSSKSDKILCQESVKTQTLEPLTEEIGVQAFENEPFVGLLSKQEVCESINIENFIGLGMKDQPSASYQNHSVLMKRVLYQGVVYQVIVVKEQYSMEKDIVKDSQEVGTSTGDLCEEIVIQDQEQEIEVLEVIESKEAKVKKEKEESEKSLGQT